MNSVELQESYGAGLPQEYTVKGSLQLLAARKKKMHQSLWRGIATDFFLMVTGLQVNHGRVVNLDGDEIVKIVTYVRSGIAKMKIK